MSTLNPTPTFKILYFASCATFTRLPFESLPAPLSLRDLFPTLEKRYPGMTKRVLESCAVTVNLEYVDLEDEEVTGKGTDGEGMVIKEGDEVALIPPVSSG
ncbi:hypothetical protein M501DRAFT_930390 [Patellaria atrata CBS 101060]|uniref:Molybdopterin synthase sulfur carrier subunit n=1 Tax=Patellaria atrata CBS 101060 TaxID=1346257 RepID=A0A9P4SEE9_9PEZI|nr:hypothetical protein M501DRAFT_930390 [Patellaria atrata CBS 101060]